MNFKSIHNKACTTLLLWQCSALTFAQSKLGDNDKAASNLIQDFLTELSWFKVLLIAVFGFLGLWYAVTGINSWIKSNDPNQRQEHKADNAIFRTIGGVALISVGFLIMVLGNTFFDTGEQIEQHYNSENYKK
tara:strand:+ start:37 stop:435 length:399 start_codon:yes stop_codon:yes gene_type:complete